MKTDELDFQLPPELIAQTPAPGRSQSRMLHYRRQSGEIAHRRFSDLPSMLKSGDVLVFNDARVLPARLMLRKSTGGRIEGLFLAEISPGRWLCLLRNLGNASLPAVLRFESAYELCAMVTESRAEGEFVLEISSSQPASQILDRIGRMPLPPYIKRQKDRDELDDLDRHRYQTVYARHPGAVAAPTAGLHFSDDLLAQLDDCGVQRATVTLHVGLGTFKPVTVEKLEDHAMHSERYHIPGLTAETLNRANRDRRRVIAVGTTAARVLESQPENSPFVETVGETSIFIYPQYRWKHVDALITNFHLPRSTLIALVAAFVGLEEQRRIYREAIEQRFRFFSYGDAMFAD